MSRKIDQFGRKRCQKKRKDAGYKLLQEIFQKYLIAHERWAVINLISTYYTLDGFLRWHCIIDPDYDKNVAAVRKHAKERLE